jgi:hypothetical protein
VEMDNQDITSVNPSTKFCMALWELQCCCHLEAWPRGSYENYAVHTPCSACNVIFIYI